MQPFNLPKCVVTALLMVEGLFICYFTVREVLINFLGRKLQQMFLGQAYYCLSSVTLEYCTAISFENVSSCFYERIASSQWNNFFSTCSVQYVKNFTRGRQSMKGRQFMTPSSPNQLLVILLRANKIFGEI